MKIGVISFSGSGFTSDTFEMQLIIQNQNFVLNIKIQLIKQNLI